MAYCVNLNAPLLSITILIDGIFLNSNLNIKCMRISKALGFDWIFRCAYGIFNIGRERGNKYNFFFCSDYVVIQSRRINCKFERIRTFCCRSLAVSPDSLFLPTEIATTNDSISKIRKFSFIFFCSNCGPPFYWHWNIFLLAGHVRVYGLWDVQQNQTTNECECIDSHHSTKMKQ